MKPAADPQRDAVSQALIERARTGDRAAVGELFRLHVVRVHRIVYRLIGASSEVDDLTQTVFIEAFRSLPSFRGDSLFSTWLGRIAVRVTMHSVRRPALRLVPLDEIEHPAAADVAADDAAMQSRRLERLDALLALLKPKKRAAFVLHVLEGHPIDETAAMVGASVAAVKVRIHDARRELERRARKDPWLAELLEVRP